MSEVTKSQGKEWESLGAASFLFEFKHLSFLLCHTACLY